MFCEYYLITEYVDQNVCCEIHPFRSFAYNNTLIFIYNTAHIYTYFYIKNKGIRQYFKINNGLKRMK